jgi:hypothetical protein
MGKSRANVLANRAFDALGMCSRGTLKGVFEILHLHARHVFGQGGFVHTTVTTILSSARGKDILRGKASAYTGCLPIRCLVAPPQSGIGDANGAVNFHQDASEMSKASFRSISPSRPFRMRMVQVPLRQS